MIKAVDVGSGVTVSIEGSIIGIMDEFVAIIKTIKEDFREELSEEFVDAIIASCGQMAYADNKEAEKKVAAEISKRITEEKLAGRL